MVLKGEEARVKAKFFPKLARVAAHVPFAEDLVAAYFCARQPELLADSRFATNRARVAHREELRVLLGEAFAGRAVDDWIARMVAADLAAAGAAVVFAGACFTSGAA